MSGLADRIIEANNRQDNAGFDFEKNNFFGIPLDLPEVDACGLPTSDSLDYFVARLIAYNYRFDKDGHLHMRGDEHIWKGNHWVSENTDNLYRIARWGKPIKAYQREAIWRRVREVLPRLSRDKLVVTDKLVWNRDTGELEEIDQKPNTIF